MRLILNHPPDNPVAQNLLIKQLERFDLHVVATSNGEEALAGELLHKLIKCIDPNIPFRMGGA